VLFDEEARTGYVTRIAEFASTMRWAQVLQPLLKFVADPHHAPDDPRNLVTPRTRIINDLETRIRGVESSTSWRLTRPIREVKDAVARLRNKQPR
jgi:hypothetical protein